ncbi:MULTISPECIES: hypothetical protein [Brachybacterium]|uniref:Uncharacterized protein n=2 Tax=Brachybacterium TaxID=43668 RepID=A0A426SPW1_9MICO|nr:MULTISPECIES: hypothetical protein [Brachybacterium]RRR20236.1 hypothetical protein DS079_02215 [Brachybacterium paraconglomeratum]GLI32106.1 hypothetical protein BCONGLO52_29470 [Brachybacterium conglomeratum]GLK03640.1 hypothetical protein GCM10017597_04390 [Brachybacterium conglomeratum]
MSASLGPVREVWAQRSRARSRGDLLYLLYVVAMGAVVLGLPALLSAGRALARGDVLALLLSAGAPPTATALSLAVAAGLLGLGAVRGPALLPPFFTATLAGGPLPRGRVLRRPFARALLLPLLAAALPAVLVAATLMAAGRTGPGTAALLALAGAGLGLLWGGAWSAGQLLRPTPRRLLVLLLGLGAGIAAAPPLLAVRESDRGMWSQSVAPSGGQVAAWAVGLAAAGAAGVALCTGLLGRLRGTELAVQAMRWEAATTAAASTDLAGAAGAFRALPAAGRRLRAIGGGPTALLYARRDAVAWLRTPDRCAGGALAVLLGAVALGGAPLLPGPAAWTALLLGALALRTGAGAFVDGIRHGVHTLGAPPLLGQRAGTQLLLHAAAPGLLLVALGALGGTLAAVVGGGAGSGSVLLPVAVAATVLAARAWEAAKGTMPLALATPIPTPQGDLSVLVMLAWQADAVVVPLLGAAALLLVLPSGPGAVLLTAAALVGLLVLLTRRRLRELQA